MYSKKPEWCGAVYAYPVSCMAAEERFLKEFVYNDKTPLSGKSLGIIRRIIGRNGGKITKGETIMTPEELDIRLRSHSKHEKLYLQGWQNPEIIRVMKEIVFFRV